jgi:two-component system nitrate/nitrite response regulator NarL
MSCQVLLVDDHQLIRDGIKSLIEQSGEFQVTAEAENAADALRLTKQTSPDLIVVDVGMPSLNGIETARRILQHSAAARVVMLAMIDDEEAVITALQYGARGLVLKRSSAADLLDALRMVARGGSYFSSQISDHLLSRFRRGNAGEAAPAPLSQRLTAREREVLRLVAAGRTSKEIAARLDIGVETVRSYRKSMMRKLGVNNIASLIQAAVQQDLTGWTRRGSGV